MSRQVSSSMFKAWFDFFRIKFLIFFKFLTWRDQSNYYYCLYQCNRCFSWFVMQIKFLWFFFSILSFNHQIFVRITLNNMSWNQLESLFDRTMKSVNFSSNFYFSITFFSTRSIYALARLSDENFKFRVSYVIMFFSLISNFLLFVLFV